MMMLIMVMMMVMMITTIAPAPFILFLITMMAIERRISNLVQVS